MLLSSNVGKTYKVAVVPSEFTSNIAEFGAPMIKLVSLNPKEVGEDDKEKLPAGYTRVGWIAGIGSVVDTGYYPNHNSEILIDRSGLMDYTLGRFMCGSTSGSNSGGPVGYLVTGYANSDYAMLACIFGSLSSQDLQTAMFPFPHGAVYWDPEAADDPYSMFEGYDLEISETRYSIYMSKDELRVGPNSVPNPATPVSPDPWDIPFSLFGISGTDGSDGSDILSQPMPDMIFSFKVSENGVPVVNMLPCIEDATGQAGFYDTVRKVFITGYSPDESNPGILIPGGKPPRPLTPDTFVDCVTYVDVASVYPGYKTIENWNYRLDNLQIGGGGSASMPVGMFMSLQLTNGYAEPMPNTVLKSFTVDLPNLTDGSYMFAGCVGLTSWDIELPKLTDGSYMFASCTGLTSWDIELPNLTNGDHMFYCCAGLTSWDIELPNLTDGGSMFYGCKGLTSWDIELPKLTNGYGMFNGCTGLTSFTSDLPALVDGGFMFGYSNSDCTKLDLASVQHIANTINDISEEEFNGSYGWGKLYIGMDASLKNTEELKTALAAIRAKGWTVSEMYRS